MENCKPVITPIEIGTKLSKNDQGSKVDQTLYKKLVRSLMYFTAMRSDIMFVVSLISIFMESPKSTHCILYTSDLDFKLTGYTYSDFAGNIDDKKRTSGYVFRFGLISVSWTSKKKFVLTLSSVEAKYVETIEATCQTMWMRRILTKLLHE